MSDAEETLNKIKKYVEIALNQLMNEKRFSINQGNQIAFAYNQGSIDVISDLIYILSGGEIESDLNLLRNKAYLKEVKKLTDNKY
jgi:hypothetical protein